MGTVLATIDYDITLRLPLGLDFKLLQGPFYLVYELSLDLFGLFFVVGLGLALYRRFVVRPARIDPTAHFAWILALLFVDQRDRLRPGGVPARGGEAVVGAVVAGRLGAGAGLRWRSGMGEGALRGLHLGTWLFHFTISLRVHRADPALLLRPPDHDAAQHVPREAHARGARSSRS